jgi:PAS domain S-box-containing protein
MEYTFRVLMLEDNPGDAELNAEQISDSGLKFTYHRVENESDYLRELEEFKPDIILADYKLPQFDGITALHLAHERYPLIPFIIVSGAVGEEVAIRMLKEGAADYILKKNIARLGSAVLNAIEVRRTKEDKARAEEELKKSYQELALMNKELQLEIITRRLAEERLRKTGETLEKIFSTTHICIVYLDKEFNFLRVNRAFAEECGHDENYFIGRNYFALYPDAKNERIFRRTVKTGEAISVFARPFEYMEFPEGERTYWDWTITPVKDYDGSVKELIFILVNVTDRILSQERVQESERKYRELADFLPQTIIETDAKGNIQLTNRNGLLVFGYTDADLPDCLNIYNIIVPEERERAKKNFDTIIKNGLTRTNEYTAIRKDGTTFPIIIYVNPIIKNDHVIGLRAIIIDITERKEMEDTIRLNEARLKQAQRIAHLGCWEWDILTNELYWSEEVFNIFGLNPKVFIPTYETLLNCVHHEDRDKVISAVDDAILNNRSYNVDHRIVLPSGEIRIVNEQGEKVFNSEGRAVRMIGTVLDITPLKIAEQKRTEAIQLAEKTSRLASIGAVAGGITHEINQPLNAIKVSVDGIIFWYQNHKGIVPEQFISMLMKISASVNRINDIIKHMRTFWVTHDHEPREEFDLNKVVTIALSLVMSRLSGHGIKTVTKLCEPAPVIAGNPIHVEQIVINLINNAINALDNVSKKGKAILVKTVLEDTSVKLMVIDNGTGIPVEIGDRIFDPFYSTRKPGEGMGLGLSIVKQFVEEQKGTIEFENNPSGGAIFTMCFPLSQKTLINNKDE